MAPVPALDLTTSLPRHTMPHCTRPHLMSFAAAKAISISRSPRWRCRCAPPPPDPVHGTWLLCAVLFCGYPCVPPKTSLSLIVCARTAFLRAASVCPPPLPSFGGLVSLVGVSAGACHACSSPPPGLFLQKVMTISVVSRTSLVRSSSSPARAETWASSPFALWEGVGGWGGGAQWALQGGLGCTPNAASVWDSHPAWEG